MSESVIAVTDVAKRFGTKRVLESVTFQVEPGQIFAFLGRNGAGREPARHLRILESRWTGDLGDHHVDGRDSRVPSAGSASAHTARETERGLRAARPLRSRGNGVRPPRGPDRLRRARSCSTAACGHYAAPGENFRAMSPLSDGNVLLAGRSLHVVVPPRPVK